MAYLSYRRLASSTTYPQDHLAIESEDEDLLCDDEREMQAEDIVQECERKEEDVVLENAINPQDEVENDENAPNSLQGSSQEMPLLEEEGFEEAEEGILAPINENESGVPSKIGKRKPIKKQWRKEKRESATEAVLASPDEQ
jgi:hypothetical protein